VFLITLWIIFLVLGYGLFKILAIICFPISFTKNAINVIQLQGGFDVLAEIDIEERKKKN